ncbi:MAG: hypothetical protein HOO95_09900 [Gallionella sp.]|nr:hypothetical protein [Gallionella sp.]
MKTKFVILIGLFLVLQPLAVFAYPGESIVLDTNGDYTITYWNGVRILQVKHVPATKIEPTLSSSFNLGGAWLNTYSYSLANGQNAKQPIRSIYVRGMTSIFSQQPMTEISSGMSIAASLAAMQSLSAPIVTPARWESLAGNEPDSAAKQIMWSFYTASHPNDPLIGVMPNTTQSGFGFASLDLPGVVAVQLEGYTPIQQGYEDEGPIPDSAIYAQLDQLEKNDFLLRNAAAPMIAIPTPYDAAVTLENIQTHAHTWITKQLLNATFSTQLDTSFQAAIAAYRANQPQTAIIQLQTMRTLIKQQQPDADKNDVTPTVNLPAPPATIDLLAARILYFDLGYVISR